MKPMNARLVVFLLLALPTVARADFSQPGAWTVNRFDGQFTFQNESYTYELHVPCPAGQACTASSMSGTGTERFPVVAFGHGFNLGALNFRQVAAHLASWGMVVVAPDFDAPFQAIHEQNGGKMLAAIDAVIQLGQPGGALAGRVDGSRQGLAGHSAGGLSALYAAMARPSVRGVVLLDPTDQGSGARASPAPTMMLMAEPGFCNSNGNATGWYDTVAPGVARTRLKVASAKHCDVLDSSSGTVCLCASSASSASQYRVLFQRYAAAWMSAFLGCDVSALATVQQGGTALQADVQAGRVVGLVQSGVSAPPSCSAGTGADAGQPEDAGVPDAGQPATDAGSSGPGTDAGQPTADAGEAFDAGAPSPDAGTVLDAGEGDGEDVPPGGCGCAALPLPLALAWTLLPAWALRRRRAA